MTTNPPASLGRCAHCGLTGDTALFEPFNKAGNLACKATAACEIRQAGEWPPSYLSTLLRAVRNELPLATTGELAELVTDLNGYREAVTAELETRPGYKAALTAAHDYRVARAARIAVTS
jgi:hypothetical protein